MKKTFIAFALAAFITPVFAVNNTYGTEQNVEGNRNVVTGQNLTVTGNGNTVSGVDIVTTGESNVVSGIHNIVDGKINVVSGHNASASGNMSIAIGQRAEVYNSMVTAVGSDSKGFGESSVALGKGATTGKEAKASTAVGPHATAMAPSAFAGALHAYAGGAQSVALGQSSQSMGEKSTAIGSGAQAMERFSTAVGGNTVATNEHDVALGFGSKTTGAVGTATSEVNGIKYGTYAGHRPTSEVSFGSEGYERTVTNVAAGRITKTSTDAVNGSQLFAVANQVGENAKGVETNKKAITELGDVVNVNTGNIETNTERLNNLTTLVNGINTNEGILRKEMHDLRRESRAGIAGANAIAAIPQPHAPGQTAIGAGAGYFKHEGAVAIGVSHIFKSGKWVSKAGVNFDTRKNIGAAVGLSYVWGGVPVVAPAPVVIHKTEVVEKVIVREVPSVPAHVKVRQ